MYLIYHCLKKEDCTNQPSQATSPSPSSIQSSVPAEFQVASEVRNTEELRGAIFWLVHEALPTHPIFNHHIAALS